MNFSVLDASMWREESLYVCFVLRLNRIPIGDVLKVLWHDSFIFNDRAAQNDATSHYLPQDLGGFNTQHGIE